MDPPPVSKNSEEEDQRRDEKTAQGDKTRTDLSPADLAEQKSLVVMILPQQRGHVAPKQLPVETSMII